MWRMLTTDMVMDINIKSDLKTMADQLEAMSVFAREAIKNRGADTTPLRRFSNILSTRKRCAHPMSRLGLSPSPCRT